MCWWRESSLFGLCSVFYVEVRNSWPCAGREIIYVFSIRPGGEEEKVARDSLAFRLHCIVGVGGGGMSAHSVIRVFVNNQPR